ncbi:YfgM family protein [Rappaport israeli]|uniref:YfgM family protein n=1 Tax=Rappaport israeli TaxID=1839807 RepID=UPI0009303DC3|nr:tetratricopeptide repeat protein [Rappaport israeli]
MVDRTDEETAELIREWLKQYGLTTIAGLVIGVGVLFGIQWWKNTQQDKKSQQSAVVEAVNTALENEEYSQAMALTQQQELSKDDSSALADLLAAKSAFELGDLAQAQDFLHKASQAEDILLAQTAEYRLAQVYALSGRYDEALAQAQLLKNTPYDAQIALLEGNIEQMRGRYEQALAHYQRAQAISPSAEVEALIRAIEAQLLSQ